MIDLAEADPRVAIRAERLRDARSNFDGAQAALRRQLYDAFAGICSARAGDRIRAVVSHSRREIEGRAVILSDGTRMGLYVDTGHERFPVAIASDGSGYYVTVLRRTSALTTV